MKCTTALSALFCIFYSTTTLAAVTPIILISNEAGTEWQQQKTTANAQLFSINQYENSLLATGSNTKDGHGIVLKSIDGGYNWSSVLTNADASSSVNGSSVINNTIVTIGTANSYASQFYLSNDSINWNPQPGSIALSSISNNGQELFVVGHNNNRLADIIVSHDNGNHWESQANSLPSILTDRYNCYSSDLSSITWDSIQWIATGTYSNWGSSSSVGVVITSLDGQNWILQFSTYQVKNILGISSNGREWLAIGSSMFNSIHDANTLIKSIDQGKTWDFANNLPSNMKFKKIRWNGKAWALVGTNDSNKIPVLFTSADGVKWTQQILPAVVTKTTGDSSLNDIIWDGSKWIAVGEYEYVEPTHNICTDLTGTNWSGTLKTSNSFYSILVNSLNIGKVYDSGTVAQTILTYNNGNNIGLGGDCIQNSDGSATVNLSNNNTPLGSYSLIFTKKTSTDNTITVTQSNIEGKDYIGVLSQVTFKKKPKKV